MLLKFLKYTAISLISILLIAMVLPYLIPLGQKKFSTEEKPFSNSKFLDVDGIRLHYRTFIPASEPKAYILLIHGFSGSTFSWRKNDQIFCDSGYYVLSVDLPSFGFSEKEKNNFDHGAAAQADKCARIIKKEGLINKNWIAMGHSMGANTAWHFALQYNKSCSKLFLVDGAAALRSNIKRSPWVVFWSYVASFPPFQAWIECIAVYQFFNEKKFTELLSSAYGEKPNISSVRGYLRPFLYRKSAQSIIQGFLYLQEEYNINLKQMRSDVYMIWGTEDRWVPLEAAQKFIKSYPLARLYQIQGTGHCPMETKAREFNQIVLEQLNKE